MLPPISKETPKQIQFSWKNYELKNLLKIVSLMLMLASSLGSFR